MNSERTRTCADSDLDEEDHSRRVEFDAPRSGFAHRIGDFHFLGAVLTLQTDKEHNCPPTDVQSESRLRPIVAVAYSIGIEDRVGLSEVFLHVGG